MLEKVWGWVTAHKAPIGAVLAFIAAGLKGTGYDSAAAVVGVVAAWLAGAGLHPSDKAVKSFTDPK